MCLYESEINIMLSPIVTHVASMTSSYHDSALRFARIDRGKIRALGRAELDGAAVLENRIKILLFKL